MRKRIAARAAVCAIVLAAGPAAARLTEINVIAVESFADSAIFGDPGAYERVKGTFKGELDPADPRNKVIVNLDRAPKNAAGRVEYEADFHILRPVDPARGSRKILFDVTNRGRQYAHWVLMDARTVRNDPRSLEDAGNGLLLRRGYVRLLGAAGWRVLAFGTRHGVRSLAQLRRLVTRAFARSPEAWELGGGDDADGGIHRTAR